MSPTDHRSFVCDRQQFTTRANQFIYAVVNADKT